MWYVLRVNVYMCGRHEQNNKWVFILTPSQHLLQSVEASSEMKKKTNCLIFRWILDAKFAYWPCWKDLCCETSGTIAECIFVWMCECVCFSALSTSWTSSNIHTICAVTRIHSLFLLCYLIFFWHSNALFYVCKWHECGR